MASSADADSFFRTELVDIRARSARGEPVYAVFSIDDVLCDTRWRTLAIAKAFDRAHDTHHFEGLTLTDISQTPQETCRRKAVPARVQKSFVRHWDSVFWRASNFELDRPFSRLLSLVKAAEAAGADVIYLTARFDSVRAQTLAQLRRFGLPVQEQMLFTRPDDAPSAEAFKRDTLAQWVQSRVRVAWFVTASRPEVSSIQKQLPSLPCVLLETPWRTPGTEPIREDTLILTLNE